MLKIERVAAFGLPCAAADTRSAAMQVPTWNSGARAGERGWLPPS
jgi:hypothetical protein